MMPSRGIWILIAKKDSHLAPSIAMFECPPLIHMVRIIAARPQTRMIDLPYKYHPPSENRQQLQYSL